MPNRISDILISMVIISIFIFGIISFTSITQSDNNVTNGLMTNKLINDTYGNLSSQLSSSQDDSQASLSNLSDIPPTQEFGEIKVTSIVSATRMMKSLITGLWNTLIRLPQIVYGVSPVLASALTALIIVLLILGLWLVWRGIA
jgi:hypothetical protein